MTHEGAPAVFVIREVAPVRADPHGACEARTGSISGPFGVMEDWPICVP
jgi:hypothetical protein